MKTERRSGNEFNLDDSDSVNVSGYAAVFNVDADIGGWWIERIAPGAFSEAIKSDDVRFVVNHAGLPLARTKSGNLKLSEDDRGLFMSASLDPDDPDVRSIVPKMRRGDLNEMSFAFTADLEEWDESGDIPIRTIKRAKLYDVSIVTYPAYDETEIGLRSLNEFRKNRETRRDIAIRAKMRMRLSLESLCGSRA